MANDIFTQETVDKLNASALTFNEVVTSRAGGVASGAIIDQTLTPLGETTDTLKGRLDKLGVHVSDWASTDGGTLTSPAQAFLNNTVGSDGFGNYYSWSGVYPSGGHVVSPGTDPTAETGYVPRTDVVLRDQLADDASTVEIGQTTAGNLGKRTAGAVFITEAPFNADPTGVVDATAAINAALATGKNVYGAGKFKVSGPLTLTARGQKLYIDFPGSLLRPYHDGDVVRLTQAQQHARVNIFGLDDSSQPTQPRTGPIGSAIVIGYGGADCQTASAAGSWVHSFYGIGYTHENGAMVDFTQAHAENTTADGFRWTPNYGDNNHAYIADTHAVNCGGIGYNVISTGNLVDSNNPRSLQFVNAKGFGCGKNFFIGTSGNEGTVFSELGQTADEFGSLAYGNKIRVLETSASYQSWIDNNGQNELQGLDAFNNWTTRRRVTEIDTLSSRLEGYLTRSQTADREFTENISGTGFAMSTVKHSASSGGRRDIWQGNVQSNDTWFSYWETDGSNSDMGYKAVFREAAPNFANGFVIAPDNKNGVIRYGIGSKDVAYWDMYAIGTRVQTITPTAVLAGSDNSIALGDATHRYSTVYAGTGAINTSDEREKRFLDISEKERLAALRIKSVISKFQFNDAITAKGEESARYHFGVGAQTVRDILADCGLNPEMYAFLCYDEWGDEFIPVTVPVVDDNGEVIGSRKTGDTIQTRFAGNRYGIRYDELICFIISAI